MASLWRDKGAWLVLGVSALFVLVVINKHRVLLNMLKSGLLDQRGKQDE